MHIQAQDVEQANRRLRDARRQLLRWMARARLERKRGAAARQVARELAAFEQELSAAQALAEEIEKENRFLRERIRVLEEEPKVEAPSVPLEQLTFRLFIDGIDDE